MQKMSGKSAVLDLSLSNAELYAGCNIREVGGKPALMTPREEAVNIVGRNAHRLVAELVAGGTEELVLSGAMAIWAYLVVFHAVAHRFRLIFYDDGTPNGKVLIAAH